MLNPRAARVRGSRLGETGQGALRSVEQGEQGRQSLARSARSLRGETPDRSRESVLDAHLVLGVARDAFARLGAPRPT